MLQQTTVLAVARRYDAFLTAFPTIASLARAPREAVLAAWSGLGYYARARHLHEAARIVVARHGGRLPEDPDLLSALPGFGTYTAGAVASLAFGVPVAAADVNVTRVVSRLFAIDGNPASAAHRALVLRRAATLLPPRRPGEGLAALMDLGQLVCTPRNPDCPRCPLARGCRARRKGDAESRPARRKRPAPVTLHVAAAVARQGNRALLVRRRAGYLAGLWEFPCAEATSAAAARRALQRRCQELGLRVASSERARAAHAIVGRRLKIRVFAAEADSRAADIPRSSPSRWLTAAQARGAALPTLTKKIAKAAGFFPGGVP
jgi:A/G-specific adenine glycosylase